MKFNNNQDKYKVKQIIDKNLIIFLENNNLLDVFIDRIIRNNPCLRFDDKKFKISSISAAFIWKETFEGNDFWKNLSAKYRQFMQFVEM